ncbi:DMT family transporter [Dictyobacter arantiisoli]|uniref:Multidrug transporter n=1 Tax=Dictyobacter arantiisoli TaxID=2014874 RepID=A0A5A5TF02_9CHLR|nr:DMT family transporter [Dictyobacter arantiisoli]GCF09653.1 multidrug transporter [Dictyobacter arantiisoli]
MKKLTASIQVLLGAASFGILSTIVKLSYSHGFSTADITGSQILFGCLCLWLLSSRSFKELRSLSARRIGTLLLCGIFTGTTGIFYYLALQSVSASLGVVLLFQFVWMGFLLDWILYRHRPTRNQWIAIVVVLLGTVLAAGNEALSTRHLSLPGIILGLLAAASYTANLTVNGRIEPTVSPILRSTLLITGGTIITLLVFPPQFISNGSLSHELWLYTIPLALFGIIIPPYLYARGIPTVGPAMASILGSIELPIVITSSALILREPIAYSQWFGVLLIILGIFISEQRIILHKNFKIRKA